VRCVDLIGTTSQKGVWGIPEETLLWPSGPKRKKMLDEYDDEFPLLEGMAVEYAP
jgi:hypothetical protein